MRQTHRNFLGVLAKAGRELRANCYELERAAGSPTYTWTVQDNLKADGLITTTIRAAGPDGRGRSVWVSITSKGLEALTS